MFFAAFTGRKSKRPGITDHVRSILGKNKASSLPESKTASKTARMNGAIQSVVQKSVAFAGRKHSIVALCRAPAKCAPTLPRRRRPSTAASATTSITVHSGKNTLHLHTRVVCDTTRTQENIHTLPLGTRSLLLASVFVAVFATCSCLPRDRLAPASVHAAATTLQPDKPGAQGQQRPSSLDRTLHHR